MLLRGCGQPQVARGQAPLQGGRSYVPLRSASPSSASTSPAGCCLTSFSAAPLGRVTALSSPGPAPALAPSPRAQPVPALGRRAQFVASASSSSASSSAASVAAAESRIEEPSTALLLAYFAAANRSLFAAQCLVEALVELYREGRSFEELQLMLRLATQGAAARARAAASAAASGAEAEAGTGGEEVVQPPLLQSQDEDVLASWVALVFLTLDELGVPRDLVSSASDSSAPTSYSGAGPAISVAGPGGGGGKSEGSTYLRGMLGYVRQTLGMYDEGQSLTAVAGLQGLVQQSSNAASSPFLLLMQQYTRLVLLTVEVVAAAGLATERPLRPAEAVSVRSSGYVGAFSGSCNDVAAALDADASAQQQQPCPSRGLAVRMLIAFMGAVLGSTWSLDKFVEAIRVAYDQGVAADELFAELDEREFAQSGGLLPISSQPPAAGSSQLPVAPQHEITKTLLSSWISLSYMTLAQLAVPYPSAGEKLGWAWAGFGDPIEAIGMNDFVGNVIRQMAGGDPRTTPAPPPPPDMVAQNLGPAGGEEEEEEEGASEGEEEPAGKGLEQLSKERRPRRSGPGSPLLRVQDDSLSSTSTAFRVLSQQVTLVQAVSRSVGFGSA
ncbi:hypothetical protein HYH03_011421 [Edaphochlamys debaryana]|uniref:Uncharacterized protein n=1 Tax=Edaphochlamys debaryana TaxID=47281 RepID=A0A835Y058_9CHLO|nr:hypothetical protein HYH03_011421 [Edaphochlamys debaryana]|eukprot:KAG2490115.1 hypothetical protein HYH03_011421 [Edaphochlamys debaryana]